MTCWALVLIFSLQHTWGTFLCTSYSAADQMFSRVTDCESEVSLPGTRGLLVLVGAWWTAVVVSGGLSCLNDIIRFHNNKENKSFIKVSETGMKSHRPLWFWNEKRWKQSEQDAYRSEQDSQVKCLDRRGLEDSPSLSGLRGKMMGGKATVSRMFWRKYPLPAGQILLKATEQQEDRIAHVRKIYTTLIYLQFI